MEMPEDLRELVDRFGQALVQALALDPECRKLARQIQTHGFDIGLMIEATVALHQREEGAKAEDGEEETDFRVQTSFEEFAQRSPDDQRGPLWSESDRAFLRTFKISLD
jgi:hypothetical protein